jgi:hypothetical protein
MTKFLFTIPEFALIMSIIVPSGFGATDTVGSVRIQTLSPTLVRLEVKGQKGFEDRATFHVLDRSWTGVAMTRNVAGGMVTFTTATYNVKVPAGATALAGIIITAPAGDTLWAGSTTSITATLKCRWTDHGDMYLSDDGTKVTYGPNTGSDSCQWIINRCNDTITIMNKATGHYMNIAHGLDYIESSAMTAVVPSARWILENADPFFRIRNSTTARKYIQTEQNKGYAQCDTMLTTWYSAQWTITGLTGSFDLLNSNRVALPGPTSKPVSFAFADVPRIVLPSWGYNVAPSGSLYPSVNGWDTTNYANDVYVFLPNSDVKTLRSDYIRLTGRTEMMPLYAFGSWDSRYYAYTQSEALGKIDTFRVKQIPLDVLVIDTDWRVGASSGYAVNTTLFPDMTAFLTDAHAKNVRIMFNDHPEPQAASVLSPAEVLFRNNGLRGKFDIGLDIWWFDRNWSTCIIPPVGINKEVFGMYLYNWVTKDYYPARRPLIMANVDGIDNGSFDANPNIAAHRYSCQWTGDLTSNISSLGQDIANMLRNGIIGPFAYTSSDLGGHQGQPTAQEYCRWIEYGSFSPLYRPHCTQTMTRNPWQFAAPVEEVARNFIQMRMRLLPVFYTAAKESYDSGEPILRRCDFDYPAYADAQAGDQYFLGHEILVAPLVTTDTIRSVWLPPGKWINLFSGDTVSGGAKKSVKASIKQIPLFVKQGTVFPLAPDMQYSGEKPWDPITLDAYPDPGQIASGSLYEDDGISNGYKAGEFRTTQFSVQPDAVNKIMTVTIQPVVGTFTGATANRSWIIRMRKPSLWTDSLQAVTVDGQDAAWTNFARSGLAMPLQSTGAGPDGLVSQVNVPGGAVSSARAVVFYYGNPVGVKNRITRMSRASIVLNKGKNMIVRCPGCDGETHGIAVSVHALNGRLVSRIHQSTTGINSIISITGDKGASLARGIYLYTVTVTQAGLETFQAKGVMSLMP